jgi:hypothetical protein
MSQKEGLLTPVGRLVQGSLYEPQTTDAENKPLTIRTGPQAGQPRVDYFFSLAIPKSTEKHWAETPWGQKIWAAGHAGFPNGQASAPTFAWKVTDGDSQIPNRVGKKPCDREGHKGHWVLNFSSGFAPQIVNEDGSSYLLEKDYVNLGDYIQVAGTVTDNGSQQQPGVFLNHSHVAFVRYGKRITIGVDPKSIGFGKGTVIPMDGSLTPPAQGFATPPVVMPVTNGYTPPNAATYSPPPAVQTPAPAPYPGILGAPTVSVAIPQRTMLPPANGATYEQMVANGWNDQMLIQHGMMQA